jgi:hypothetical protein
VTDLVQQHDPSEGVNENFCYDTLGRLTDSFVTETFTSDHLPLAANDNQFAIVAAAAVESVSIDALGRDVVVSYPDTGSVSYAYNALTVTRTQTVNNLVTDTQTTQVTSTVSVRRSTRLEREARLQTSSRARGRRCG